MCSWACLTGTDVDAAVFTSCQSTAVGRPSPEDKGQILAWTSSGSPFPGAAQPPRARTTCAGAVGSQRRRLSCGVHQRTPGKVQTLDVKKQEILQKLAKSSWYTEMQRARTAVLGKEQSGEASHDLVSKAATTWPSSWLWGSGVDRRRGRCHGIESQRSALTLRANRLSAKAQKQLKGGDGHLNSRGQEHRAALCKKRDYTKGTNLIKMDKGPKGTNKNYKTLKRRHGRGSR